MALTDREVSELVILEARSFRDDEHELATLARIALRLDYAVKALEISMARVQRLVHGG